MQENDIKAVIFDFDGTVADTLPVVIRIAQKLNHKLKLFKEEVVNIEELRNISSTDFFKRVNMPFYKLIYYLWLFRHLLGKEIEYVPIIPGLQEILTIIHEKGIKLAVVSINTESNIKKFIKAKNITVFDEVDCPFFSFNKARVIKRVMEKLGATPENTLYVGDETRDIESAHKIGVKIVSVTWGYQFREILVRFKPDYTVDTPEELLDIFE